MIALTRLFRLNNIKKPVNHKISGLTEHVSAKIVLMFTLSQAMLLLPLKGELYIWLAPLALALYGWRVLISYDSATPPTRLRVNLLAIMVSAFVILQIPSSSMLRAMVNLLIMTAGFKLLSIQRVGEVTRLALINFFAIAACFIYVQTLAISGWLFTSLLLNTLAVFVAYTPSFSFKARLKRYASMVAISFPIMVLLFIFVPRLGPLWKMPDRNSAHTGLSEHVSPGQIANLAQSAELAFRVTFEDTRPDKSQLYWRTLTHEQYDGMSWTTHPYRKTRLNKSSILSNNELFNNYPALTSLSYSIVVEPSHSSWLHTLDTPVKHSSQILYKRDRRIEKTTPVTQKFQYSITSVPELTRVLPPSPQELLLNLKVPADINPEARQLAQQLRQTSTSDKAFIQRLLNWFKTKGFTYTLKPPLLTSINQVDQFINSSKQGFCSHYASAFTFMMRSVGLPARVVSGYLGGEYSENNQYLSVRQYDAHAWSEVWLQGEGWVRVDPTAVVAPDRLLYGLQGAVDEETFLEEQTFSLVKYRDVALANWLRTSLENMDYYWSSWVVRFDRSDRRQLMNYLKNNSYSLVMSTLLVAATLLLFSYLLHLWRKYTGLNRQSDEKQAFRQLQQLHASLFSTRNELPPVSLLADIEQRVTTPLQSETNGFQSTIYALQSTLKTQIAAIRQAFIEQLYQPASTSQASIPLSKQVRQLTRAVNQYLKEEKKHESTSAK